ELEVRGRVLGRAGSTRPKREAGAMAQRKQLRVEPGVARRAALRGQSLDRGEELLDVAAPVTLRRRQARGGLDGGVSAPSACAKDHRVRTYQAANRGRDPASPAEVLDIRRGLGVGEETAAVERSKRVGGSAGARGWRLVGRSLDYLEADVGGATALVAAIAASVTLSLYLTRGTTF